MKDIDLKPCPFCGCKDVRLMTYKEDNNAGVDAVIKCPGCLTDFFLHSAPPRVGMNAEVRWVRDYDKTVFEKYNRRVSDGQ